jgi:hypothetical protein
MTIESVPTALVLGFSRFCTGLSVHGRFRAPIPKHNCAIFDVLLGFHL